MGYLSSGYAFNGTPNWEAIKARFSKFSLQGYKHKNSDVTLLDIWRPHKNVQKHFPFCSEPVLARHVEPPLPKSEVASTFDDIMDILPDGEERYGREWLTLPLLISSVAGLPTFAFTADDDVYNYAAYAEAGRIIEMRCRLDEYDIVLMNDVFNVMGIEIDEYDVQRDDGNDFLMESLKALKNVQLKPIVKRSGDFLIYQHPMDVWPAKWGNATELMGFGTFDPLEKLSTDFENTFEYHPTTSRSIQRSWWKFW